MKKLSYHTALTSGSDLWVLPDRKWSSWIPKIDWYLNLQISKPYPHTTLSKKQIERLTSEWELPYFKPQKEYPARMIASAKLLPNTRTVILPFSQEKGMKPWLCKVYEIWKNIQSQSLRIFLPDGQEYNQAIIDWPKQSTLDIVTVVEFKKSS